MLDEADLERTFTSVTKHLPLPKGEGWGEGERGAILLRVHAGRPYLFYSLAVCTGNAESTTPLFVSPK
jgi:hypothetical protein